MKKRIVILGSTGSIGSNLIELIINNKSKFKVELLSTNKNITKVVNQAKILKTRIFQRNFRINVFCRSFKFSEAKCIITNFSI